MRNAIGGLFGVPGHPFRFVGLMLFPRAVLVAKPLAAPEPRIGYAVERLDRAAGPG